MGGIPWPDEVPDVYDAITIGEFTFRETNVNVDGASKNKIDAKAGPGLDGASTKYLGTEAAKVSITIDLWNADLFAIYQGVLLSYAVPAPGKSAPEPVEIVHPLLELHGWKKFWIDSTPVLKPLGSGIWQAKFACTEWHPGPKAAIDNRPGQGVVAKQLEKGGQQFLNAQDKPERPRRVRKPSQTNTGPRNTYGGRKRGIVE